MLKGKETENEDLENEDLENVKWKWKKQIFDHKESVYLFLHHIEYQFTCRHHSQPFRNAPTTLRAGVSLQYPDKVQRHHQTIDVRFS